MCRFQPKNRKLHDDLDSNVAFLLTKRISFGGCIELLMEEECATEKKRCVRGIGNTLPGCGVVHLRIRYRAPAVSFGSTPTDKPALPTTPAPPQPRPVSEKNVSFCQEE